MVDFLVEKGGDGNVIKYNMNDEQQFALEKTKIHLDFLKYVIFEKYRYLIIISTISFAVLAFFASELKCVDLYSRIIITLFLVLAIFSMWFYFIELAIAERDVLSGLGSAAEKVKKQKTIKDKIRAYAPHVALVVFTLLIFTTIFYTWGVQWN